MSFWIAKEGETVVVGVEGQLVTGNRQELKDLLLAELARGEQRFRIDFGRAGYIDSAGLGVLVSIAKKVREVRGELRLVNLNDDLRRMFRLTKLDTILRIDESDGEGTAGRPAPLDPRGPGPRHGSEGPSPDRTPPP